jgi:hypothetical protein
MSAGGLQHRGARARAVCTEKFGNMFYTNVHVIGKPVTSRGERLEVATTSAEMSHGAHKPAPRAEMSSEHARLAKTGYVVWCALTAPHALSLGAFQQPSTFNMKHDSLNDRDICDTNMARTERR